MIERGGTVAWNGARPPGRAAPPALARGAGDWDRAGELYLTVSTKNQGVSRYMSAYQAPLRDFQFLLKELVDFDSLVKLPGYEEVADIADAVLEEAGNFASSLLDPLKVVAPAIRMEAVVGTFLEIHWAMGK